MDYNRGRARSRSTANNIKFQIRMNRIACCGVCKDGSTLSRFLGVLNGSQIGKLGSFLGNQIGRSRLGLGFQGGFNYEETRCKSLK